MKTVSDNEYNRIPVAYCKRCNSLRILVGEEFPDYCDVCGSTDIGEESIEDWLEEEARLESLRPKEKSLFND